jgi:hypothetical protein
VKFIIFITLLISCSSNKGTVNSDQPELEIVNSNSIDKLFEGHQVGSIKGNIRRSPASSGSHSNINQFRDTLALLTRKIATHIVSSNSETLMLIAYNLYGDFSYWKSLAHLNKNILSSPYKLKKGLKLKYYIPKRDFTYQPEGLPFLIKYGQSLSKISDIVYENWRRWPEIYENNRPLIKNPDEIYAGFTLYYLDDPNELVSSVKTSLRKKAIKNSRSQNRLFLLMKHNINKKGILTVNRRVPSKSWSLEQLKNKFKKKRLPSSEAETKFVPKKVRLRENEIKSLQEVKKAVKVNQRRKKNSKTKSSLLDKVKNSFKQFEYY